jgi:hypothetical protein
MSEPIDISPEGVAAMLDGVTPGPWRIKDCESYGDRCKMFYQEVWNDETDILVTTEVTRAHNDGGQKNLRFIAWARDAVPALSARLAEVEKERDKAQSFGQDMVARAASGGVLDGYRELGARAAAAESRADAAEAKLAQAVEALKALVEAHENGWPDGKDWGAGNLARAALAKIGGDA